MLQTVRTSSRVKAKRHVQQLNEAGKLVYCVCREIDDGNFMIQCDTCKDWFHGDCVGITEEEAQHIESFECSLCVEFEQAGTGKERITYASDSTSRANTRKSAVSQQLTPPPTEQEVQNNDPVRKMARKGFSETFAGIFAEVDDATIDVSNPAAYAVLVEEELFNEFSATNSIGNLECGPKYKSKYRSLQFNLKDKNNTKLRRRILVGEITPTSLVLLTPEELANDEFTVIAEQVRKRSFQSSVRPKIDETSIIQKTHKGEVEIFLPKETVIPKAADTVKKLPAPVVAAVKKDKEVAVVKKKIESLDDILSRMASSDVLIAPSNKRSLEVQASSSSNSISNKRSKVDNMKASSSTPRSSSSKANSVWSGKLHMPQVGKYTGFCRQVAGNPIKGREAWADILPAALTIDGRIPIDKVTEYLAQQRNSTTKHIVVVEFCCGDEKADVEGYEALFRYFHSRQRYAVIGHHYVSVKDMYVIPVKKGQTLPAFMEWIPGGNTYVNDRNVLLGVCILLNDVVVKPKRSSGVDSATMLLNSILGPNQQSSSIQTSQQQQPLAMLNSIPQSTLASLLSHFTTNGGDKSLLQSLPSYNNNNRK